MSTDATPYSPTAEDLEVMRQAFLSHVSFLEKGNRVSIYTVGDRMAMTPAQRALLDEFVSEQYLAFRRRESFERIYAGRALEDAAGVLDAWIFQRLLESRLPAAEEPTKRSRL